MSVINAAYHWIHNSIFFPTGVDEATGLVDVERATVPSAGHAEDECPVCLDPAFQEPADPSRRLWVIVHHEVNRPDNLIHPVHLQCLVGMAQQVLQSPDRILKCPCCRARINFDSVAVAAGLPSQVIQRTWKERIIEEIPRELRRFRKRLPFTTFIASLPFIGTLSVLSLVQLVKEPTGVATQFLLRGLIPASVGTAIGVACGALLSSVIINLGAKLLDQTKLRPIPKMIVTLALAGIAAWIAFKIAVLAGAALSVLSLKMTLTSAQLPQALQLLQTFWSSSTFSWDGVAIPLQFAVGQALLTDIGVRVGAIGAVIFAGWLKEMELSYDVAFDP